MRDENQQTIFAPASGATPSAISIIRISGPKAHDAVRTLTGAPLPVARKAARRWVYDPDGARIDDALVFAFAEGASYTDEPMAEIHCHGSLAIVDRVLDLLDDIPGCRLAHPGEFTRRALFAGRIGLSEAEGLADLISAETEEQRRVAMRIYSGGLDDRVSAWHDGLLKALTLLELSIDWVDEEIPTEVTPEVETNLNDIAADLEEELRGADAVQRLKNGFEVAILGPPNAGKSSLINAIANRDAAIVSKFAGTTRDIIEVRYDLSGIPVTFLDTAGLRETDDEVESLGIERSLVRARQADLRILLQPADNPLQRTFEGDLPIELVVVSKSDLSEEEVSGVAVTTRKAGGIDCLMRAVKDNLAGRLVRPSMLTRRRHAVSVRAALERLRSACGALSVGSLEIAAGEVRSAATALQSIVGRIDQDDVLDSIFSNFCLGK